MEKKFFKTYDEVNSLRKINDFFADYSLAPHRNMPHFETLNPKQKKFKVQKIYLHCSEKRRNWEKLRVVRMVKFFLVLNLGSETTSRYTSWTQARARAGLGSEAAKRRWVSGDLSTPAQVLNTKHVHMKCSAFVNRSKVG